MVKNSPNGISVRACRGSCVADNVCYFWGSFLCILGSFLKGDGNLDHCYVLYESSDKPLILIPVSSKSVEKYGSCGRLNICKWTVMEAAIL